MTKRVQDYLPPPDFTMSMDEDIVRSTRIALDAYARDHPPLIVALPPDVQHTESSEAGGQGKDASTGQDTRG
ncbi:hypothetical protein STAQ_19720 [Allostella sp. ATCC 35155]|nr:hypothetical protein STAQ_19720 [Stella sp. ATCC 35155]